MDVSTRSSGRHVSTAEDRRRRSREEMVGAILKAARTIMREEGVAALNMHEVGRRVGLRTQSVYYYFPSKAALYDALFLLGNRIFHEQQVRLLQQQTDPWTTIRAAMEAYMTFAQQHPELWQLVFERPVPGFVPSEESMEESRRVLESGVRVIKEAIESGQMAPGLPPARATDFLSAMMHGLTAAHMANEPDLPPGSGRFGSLVPAAVEFLQKAWAPGQPKRGTASDEPNSDSTRD